MIFDDVAMTVCVDLLYTQHPTRARILLRPYFPTQSENLPSCFALFFSLSDPGNTRVSELPTSRSDI